MSNYPSLLIGLTGGIGSGKTTVSDELSDLGAYVVDTDQLAREAVKPNTNGLERIVKAFGTEILLSSGELNRSALRERIFANPADRTQLNAIVHPEIERLAHEKLSKAPAKARYSVIVIPLLVETQALNRYPINRVLVVDVNRTTQLQRLMERDTINHDKATEILSAQASREDRLAIADDVINNDGALDQLREQVAVIHEKYCQIADFIIQ